MSYSFYLPHVKKIFSKKELSIKDALDLLPGLEEFSVDKERDGFDPEEFYDCGISEAPSLLLGIAEKSARGFLLSYETRNDGTSCYKVRILTPSSLFDWELALSYLKALSKKLSVDIVSEYGDGFTAETIDSVDYRQDILFGVQSMFQENGPKDVIGFSASESPTYTMPGLIRPVVFHSDLQKNILRSADPVSAFSKMFTEIQWVDAYSASQSFYQDNKDHSVFGVYTLTEDVDTILPFEPFVEFKNAHLLEEEKIEMWKLGLVVINGDPDDPASYQTLAFVDYKGFMEKLPKNKYRFIDAAYVLVEGLSKEEMKEILGMP